MNLSAQQVIGRIQYSNLGWTVFARQKKQWARWYRRCVFCEGPLVGRQVFYCSVECQTDFLESPMYHRGIFSWEWLRIEVLRRDKYRCRKCGESANQVDHIRPLAYGGTNYEDNLQSLCTECHREKTNRQLRAKYHNSDIADSVAFFLGLKELASYIPLSQWMLIS